MCIMISRISLFVKMWQNQTTKWEIVRNKLITKKALINLSCDAETEQRNDPKIPFLTLQVLENANQMTNFSAQNLNSTKFNTEQIKFNCLTEN